MLNGLVWFIGGFALATMYFNLFLSGKAERTADEYAYDKTEYDKMENEDI